MQSRESSDICEEEVSRARNEVGESREMHVHPNMSVTIHRQNRLTFTQKLFIQHLRCNFSHPMVRFQENSAHLEGGRP